MSIEKFLNDILGIKLVGTYDSNNSYVIDLDTSEDFGVIYSKLDKNDKLEYMDTESILTSHNASLLYVYNDEFQVYLLADFDANVYKLSVVELTEDLYKDKD